MIWPFHGWTSPAPALVLPDTSLSENNSADACVQALVDYVNVLREDGLFVEHEIHPEVFDLYRADHYHSQVCNGGHSQFLYNVPSHQKTLEGAIRAFRKTGAEEFAATAADLLKWVRSNPGLAAEQDGFRSRHPDLKLLDAHFSRSTNALTITNWSDGMCAGDVTSLSCPPINIRRPSRRSCDGTGSSMPARRFQE